MDTGPDPSTLPVAAAPPSHPKIDPTIPGTLEGRSVLEVDINALADKPWRRPGSDLSDWFNYGFDEMTWEAYCYRRRDIGEVAAIMKANILVSVTLHLLFVYHIQWIWCRLLQVSRKSNSRHYRPKSVPWL